MANEEQLTRLRKGVSVWNEWRAMQPADMFVDLAGADLMDTDLSDANLSGASLENANLIHARLGGANLKQANLLESKLANVDLSGANLHEADLSGADLSCSLLSDSDLSYAGLEWANLNAADFINVNFTKAQFGETVFANTTLNNVIGLDRAIHVGPSTLDHRTLMSSDQLPIKFLRGCGLPETLIDYLPSLLSQPIAFFSCFISYSHSDKVFARRLYDQLQGRGIRCWLDEHQILPGDDIHEQIDRGIKYWDKLILCCSETALNSWWIDNEINKAFTKEQKLMSERKRKVLTLIPLDLDGYLNGQDWENGKADEVRSRKAADFTGWESDNDKFEQAFENTVKALQTNNAGRESPPKAKL